MLAIPIRKKEQKTLNIDELYIKRKLQVKSINVSLRCFIIFLILELALDI